IERVKNMACLRSIALAFLVLIGLCSAPSWAADETATMPTNYEMVQAPTAYVLMHGGYDFVTQVYENGGLFLRANVGFKNFFMFGFSANGTNMIGQGTIQIQTPKLFFKFKILDQATAPFALAVAWDDRGYGTFSNNRFYPGTQKGFYTVMSREYPDLGFLQTHLGFNLVEFDNFDASQDLGAFLGTSFAVAKPLVFNIEADKIFSSQWAFNANFVFNVENPLRVGLDLVDINNPNLFSRILRIQYTGFF
ncbi:MAG TPA: hypothetical protein VK791_00185, partial [bacterium]|nr:hypothetical protein [bacterium]